jgi:hypothetical protein
VSIPKSLISTLRRELDDSPDEDELREEAEEKVGTEIKNAGGFGVEA